VWATIGLVMLAVTSAGTGPASQDREERAMRRALWTEVQPVKLSNCDFQRFGEPADGGYLLCANLLKDVGSAYSYGINGYDQWGCDVSARTKVTTHQYDCFNTTRPSCPQGSMMFHEECVGPERATIEARPFDTVQSQIDRNGDGGKRLVMKMDVEGAEWPSLMQTPDAIFERIDQLVIEFHAKNEERPLELIRKLKRTFYVANLHFNNFSCEGSLTPFPAWAYEVLFVNKKIAVLDRSRAKPGPNRLDARNNPNAPDCQHPIG
jgi:hypothetical protein